MTSLILALALTASPDAWTFTHEFSSGSDVGNGVISASENVKTVITPTHVRRTTEKMSKGKKTKEVLKPKQLSPEVRDAIAALLPKLPLENTTYSTNPNVDDEGWVNASIVLERQGKSVTLMLQQGKGAPVPPEVDELLSLMVKALR